MNPTKFEQSNVILKSPAGMEEVCVDMDVYRGQDPEGMPVIISCWTPSPEELDELKAGKPLWLFVIGGMHPPVAIVTKHPFAESGHDS